MLEGKSFIPLLPIPVGPFDIFPKGLMSVAPAIEVERMLRSAEVDTETQAIHRQLIKSQSERLPAGIGQPGRIVRMPGSDEILHEFRIIAPALKIKRREVEKKYGDRIQALYD